MALKYCQSNAQQLFICAPYNTVGNQPVTLSEKFAIVAKQTGCGSKIDEQGRLPDEVMLGIGMKVMVTFNVEMDLDIANGARGEIIKIVLDENETNYLPMQSIIQLPVKYPPTYVLIRMKPSKVSSLEGLEQNIICTIDANGAYLSYHPGISEQDCCSQTTSTYHCICIHRLLATGTNNSECDH